jgi:hypothetical protein
LGFGYAAGFAAIALGLVRLGRAGHLIFAPLTPLYWHLHSLAGAKAVADLVRRPHHWEKTEHGVSALRPDRVNRSPVADPLEPVSPWSSGSPSRGSSSPSGSPGTRATARPVRPFRRAGLASSPGGG